jgi:hypothetical protein
MIRGLEERENAVVLGRAALSCRTDESRLFSPFRIAAVLRSRPAALRQPKAGDRPVPRPARHPLSSPAMGQCLSAANAVQTLVTTQDGNQDVVLTRNDYELVRVGGRKSRPLPPQPAPPSRCQLGICSSTATLSARTSTPPATAPFQLCR